MKTNVVAAFSVKELTHNCDILLIESAPSVFRNRGPFGQSVDEARNLCPSAKPAVQPLPFSIYQQFLLAVCKDFVSLRIRPRRRIRLPLIPLPASLCDFVVKIRSPSHP